MAYRIGLYPIVRNELSFFDDLFGRMAREVATAEHGMNAMRKQMFQLMPRDNWDVMVNEITPRVPIIQEKGETKLKLEFDVHQFKPDEVQVKILENNVLQVQAQHIEKSDQGESVRSYVRQYALPKGVESDKIQPTLSNDGVLTIEAPAPGLAPSERMIPISYNKTGEGAIESNGGEAK